MEAGKRVGFFGWAGRFGSGPARRHDSKRITRETGEQVAKMAQEAWLAYEPAARSL
jgi:hypothetical protein